jgi:hypothetical protein
MEGDAVMGLENASSLMEWLLAESGKSRRRCLWVERPEETKVSFYGQEAEVADEFRVYIMDGYTDITNVRSWSVRYVGYQAGKSFESLEDLKVWLSACILKGKNDGAAIEALLKSAVKTGTSEVARIKHDSDF